MTSRISRAAGRPVRPAAVRLRRAALEFVERCARERGLSASAAASELILLGQFLLAYRASRSRAVWHVVDDFERRWPVVS